MSDTPIADAATGHCVCGATASEDVVPRAIAVQLEQALMEAARLLQDHFEATRMVKFVSKSELIERIQQFIKERKPKTNEPQS